MTIGALAAPGSIELIRSKGPESFPGLRSYWDGRDLTPSSGVANNWTARAGSEAATLINLTSAATIASRTTSKGATVRGVTGRMQVNTPAFTSDGAVMLFQYVLQMPAALGTLRGVSAYEGKPLPLIFSFSAPNNFQVARGSTGTIFETPRVLVADVSSWAGKLLSIVVRTTPNDIRAFWRINGVAGESTYTGASTNAPPVGWTVGGFADSGGTFDTPFFCSSFIDGTGNSGSPANCRALALWGSQIWY